MLPVPRREDAVVHRRPRQAVLPLLRLRRARHRDRVPDGLREPGVRGGGGGAGAPHRTRGGARRRRRTGAASRRPRADFQRTREGEPIFPAPASPPSAGVAGSRVPQGTRPVGDDRIRVPARVRAPRVGRVAGGAGYRRVRARCAHPGRAARGARRRSSLRSVPRPNHLPHPRRAGARGRIRCPHHRRRSAEVSQLTGNSGVPEGTRALWVLARAARGTLSGAAARRRGLHGRGGARAVGNRLCGRDPGHRRDRSSRPADVSRGQRHCVLLRR